MKLTTTVLKKIIAEEVAKFQEAKLFGDMQDTKDVDAKEVDADELADSLENHINHYKALKLEEARLVKRLTKIQEAKNKFAKVIASKKKLSK